ncbi:hypothetical protein EAW52_06130 [Pseudomonas sp. LTJR-52]|nr:hypothetical protein EAW52_06130 [Pseudomonas sp. LTJR-52]
MGIYRPKQETPYPLEDACMPEADDYPKDDTQPETLDDTTPEHSKKENIDKIKYDSDDIIPPGVW